jgi:hypothetical protein
MTQIRSAMVNTNTLAALAEELGLGEHLYLGKGIAKGGGRGLKSLLANVFESVLGAIFLDAGYDAAYHYYLDRFRKLPEPVKDENYKGRLQQVVQERFNQTPFYDSAGARVGSQRREYTAVVFAGAEALGTGHGHTKQEAEQDAARDALSKLLGTAPPVPSDGARPPREARPRRRRSSTSRTTPTEPAEPIEPDAAPPSGVAVQEPPLPVEAPSEPVAEAATEGPAPAAKPRRRRAPRRKPAAATAAGPAPEPEPELEVRPTPEPEARFTPEPEREPAPAPAPEPPRSRQFGAPLDD